MLLNLIINACHAIVCRKESEAGHVGLISIATTLSGQEVQIQVKDNGCGIAEACGIASLIPSSPPRQWARGPGRGLAIVHDIIVNKHGGAFQFNSTLGEGTPSTVSLPV